MSEIGDLPQSFPEKHDSFEETYEFEHWLFVHELRTMLDQFEPSDWVQVNRIGNLAVFREGYVNPHISGNMIGWIDFYWSRVDGPISEEETEEEE